MYTCIYTYLHMCVVIW